MSEKFMMSTVVYQDWDLFLIDSVWFREELAQKRADELNADKGSSMDDWFVDEVELGDPDKR